MVATLPHRYGKLPPLTKYGEGRSLLLAKYLRTNQLPPLPAALDIYTPVLAAGGGEMFGNDTIGDCTCAAIGHALEADSLAGSGMMVRPTTDEIVAFYSLVSGYNPSTGANDRGAVVESVLTTWRKTGLQTPSGVSKILGFARVDETKHAEVLAAFQLGGILDIGFSVTQSDEDQFSAGQVWDAVADPGAILGGHSVVVGGYTQAGPLKGRAQVLNATSGGVLLGTWGTSQWATWAWWDQNITGQGPRVDECWWAATPQWFGRAGLNPVGLDLAAFGQDIAQITGEPDPFPSQRR